MFLVSLANILPRLASIAAFLCLVVAHLEWPDIPPPFDSAVPDLRLGDEVQEVLMDAEVVAHLGVEGRRHDRTLLDRHDPIPDPRNGDAREDVDAWTGVVDPWRADEHGMDRVVEDREVDVALEGVDLPAEGVAPHGDVEPAERLLSGYSVAHAVG